MELHKIIIGIILTGVMSLTIVLFLADGINTYNPSNIPSNYNSSFYKISSGISNISQTSKDTETKINSLSGNNNAIADFIGWFFGNGYQAIKTFITSVEITSTIADESIDNTLGSTSLGQHWKAAIGTIITVIILALILHFVIKSDRI